MTMKLPGPIAGYFAADRDRDAVAMASYFTPNAVAKDEGHTHTGREAIAAWMSQAWQKYDATAEPFAMTDQGTTKIVSAHVSGNFPGSPIDLRFHFVIEGQLIASLETT